MVLIIDTGVLTPPDYVSIPVESFCWLESIAKLFLSHSSDSTLALILGHGRAAALWWTLVTSPRLVTLVIAYRNQFDASYSRLL